MKEGLSLSLLVLEDTEGDMKRTEKMESYRTKKSVETQPKSCRANKKRGKGSKGLKKKIKLFCEERISENTPS